MIRTIKKAIAATGFGAAGAFGAALLDGNLTAGEVLIAVGTGLVAGVAVYKVTNAPPAG